MERFDLLGPLPAAGSTTVLEASAGTGKTFALAALVTRLVADGVAPLDSMLLITFSRAASRELRDRVRAQIAEAVGALNGPDADESNELITQLLDGSADERAQRRRRLRDALAGFDAATIATVHQFCTLVLKSLGVAGDTDAGVTLVETLDQLVTCVVNDLYLKRFGADRDEAALSYAEALSLAGKVVADPQTQLRPLGPAAGSTAAIRLSFAEAVRSELDLRKRRSGILCYDDLLSRLADALTSPDCAAGERMRNRWPIVMVDEFQDTDRVQWQVIERAFSGHSTLVLIGDPKQAIYGFRGGDIYTYLEAARTAGVRRTLGVNWRSDRVLVDSLQAVLRGAQLGDPAIVVHDVDARIAGHRLRGAPHSAPFRLRVVTRAMFGCEHPRPVPIDRLRRHIPADLAADIANLLASSAMFDGRPVTAGDVAVIVERAEHARVCQVALISVGIPAVYTGDSDVFESDAVDDWLVLLDALDQTHRSSMVRAAAATAFFGHTAEELATAGDALTDRVATILRAWAEQLREHGPAAVFEAARIAGMGARLLAELGGERAMTDIAHIGELLHQAARRDRLGLPALRDWLRSQRDQRSGPAERNRRIDSDAAAVQIMTVWGAKGLQFPIVYLPFAFDRHVFTPGVPLFHDAAGLRCLHVGGAEDPDYAAIKRLSQSEAARNDIRLTYVALTRAQSQVVAWWAPSWNEPNGGLSRLLRGRTPGQAEVPERCAAKVSDEVALNCFQAWADIGGPVLEESIIADVAPVCPAPAPTDLAARHFHRKIDTVWRRTSYSALVHHVDESGVRSEPETTFRSDETDDIGMLGVAPESVAAQLHSPMAGLPGGKAFGSLVHAILECADPGAADLCAELEQRVREHQPWWPVDVDATVLAAALVPMHDTPLGPLAQGRTLRQIGKADRLRELAFEIPLAGGDSRDRVPRVRLADIGALLRDNLLAGDPLLGYADRLTADDPGTLGSQVLRGYLSGSLDVVLRLPGPRYLVVDYKTNHLGDTAADYGFPQLASAMRHSDYPLQALLYTAVLHRFLRWRQPGYCPDTHLGGVLYLFVRGMCGPDSPIVDGHPAGVFGWRPPAGLVVALSDLLHRGRS